MATCLYCNSGCRVTLFMSSEGCSNPKCRAYEAPKAKKFVFNLKYEPQFVTTWADCENYVPSIDDLPKQGFVVQGRAEPSVDIHREIAAQMFKKPADDVTPEERNAAKTATYALIYTGQSQTVSFCADTPAGRESIHQYHENALKKYYDWHGYCRRQYGRYYKYLFGDNE